MNISKSDKDQPLAEVSAKDAKGEILGIYADIEAALGVRLVNLVYRHLATVPGALEWAWSTVGPVFADGTIRDRSVSLSDFGGVGVSSGVSMAACGLSNADAVRVIETLDAYNRANPMNALSLRVVERALRDGRPASIRVLVRPDAAPTVELLPMAGLDTLSDEVHDVLRRLAFLTTGRKDGIVPSLFRHFVSWPNLLFALADWLQPLAEEGEISRQAEIISIQAEKAAAEIYADLGPSDAGGRVPDDATRETLLRAIEVFPPAICRMIVIGGLLRRALKP